MKAFRANLLAHLIFFRRNRLVLLVGLFICFIWASTLLPSLFFVSARDKFQLIQMLIMQSRAFVMSFVAALAILALNYNFGQRCFKMVITKPCKSEVWLLSLHSAVLLVAVALYTVLLVGVLALFVAWRIPIQSGVFFVIAEGFLQLTLIVSVVSFLVSVMHPFLALITMMLANESTFFGLLTLTSAGLAHSTNPAIRLALKTGMTIAHTLYVIVPSYSLFREKTMAIHNTLRLQPGDLKWLALTFLYTILAVALFFALTALAIRRKRHT